MSLPPPPRPSTPPTSLSFLTYRRGFLVNRIPQLRAELAAYRPPSNRTPGFVDYELQRKTNLVSALERNLVELEKKIDEIEEREAAALLDGGGANNDDDDVILDGGEGPGGNAVASGSGQQTGSERANNPNRSLLNGIPSVGSGNVNQQTQLPSHLPPSSTPQQQPPTPSSPSILLPPLTPIQTRIAELRSSLATVLAPRKPAPLTFANLALQQAREETIEITKWEIESLLDLEKGIHWNPHSYKLNKFSPETLALLTAARPPPPPPKNRPLVAPRPQAPPATALKNNLQPVSQKPNPHLPAPLSSYLTHLRSRLTDIRATGGSDLRLEAEIAAFTSAGLNASMVRPSKMQGFTEEGVRLLGIFRVDLNKAKVGGAKLVGVIGTGLGKQGARPSAVAGLNGTNLVRSASPATPTSQSTAFHPQPQAGASHSAPNPIILPSYPLLPKRQSDLASSLITKLSRFLAALPMIPSFDQERNNTNEQLAALKMLLTGNLAGSERMRRKLALSGGEGLVGEVFLQVREALKEEVERQERAWELEERQGGGPFQRAQNQMAAMVQQQARPAVPPPVAPRAPITILNLPTGGGSSRPAPLTSQQLQDKLNQLIPAIASQRTILKARSDSLVFELEIYKTLQTTLEGKFGACVPNNFNWPYESRQEYQDRVQEICDVEFEIKQLAHGLGGNEAAIGKKTFQKLSEVTGGMLKRMKEIVAEEKSTREKMRLAKEVEQLKKDQQERKRWENEKKEMMQQMDWQQPQPGRERAMSVERPGIRELPDPVWTQPTSGMVRLGPAVPPAAANGHAPGNDYYQQPPANNNGYHQQPPANNNGYYQQPAAAPVFANRPPPAVADFYRSAPVHNNGYYQQPPAHVFPTNQPFPNINVPYQQPAATADDGYMDIDNEPNPYAHLGHRPGQVREPRAAKTAAMVQIRLEQSGAKSQIAQQALNKKLGGGPAAPKAKVSFTAAQKGKGNAGGAAGPNLRIKKGKGKRNLGKQAANSHVSVHGNGDIIISSARFLSTLPAIWKNNPIPNERGHEFYKYHIFVDFDAVKVGDPKEMVEHYLLFTIAPLTSDLWEGTEESGSGKGKGKQTGIGEGKWWPAEALRAVVPKGEEKFATIQYRVVDGGKMNLTEADVCNAKMVTRQLTGQGLEDGECDVTVFIAEPYGQRKKADLFSDQTNLDSSAGIPPFRKIAGTYIFVPVMAAVERHLLVHEYNDRFLGSRASISILSKALHIPVHPAEVVSHDRGEVLGDALYDVGTGEMDWDRLLILFGTGKINYGEWVHKVGSLGKSVQVKVSNKEFLKGSVRVGANQYIRRHASSLISLQPHEIFGRKDIPNCNERVSCAVYESTVPKEGDLRWAKGDRVGLKRAMLALGMEMPAMNDTDTDDVKKGWEKVLAENPMGKIATEENMKEIMDILGYKFTDVRYLNLAYIRLVTKNAGLNAVLKSIGGFLCKLIVLLYAYFEGEDNKLGDRPGALDHTKNWTISKKKFTLFCERAGLKNSISYEKLYLGTTDGQLKDFFCVLLALAHFDSGCDLSLGVAVIFEKVMLPMVQNKEGIVIDDDDEDDMMIDDDGSDGFEVLEPALRISKDAAVDLVSDEEDADADEWVPRRPPGVKEKGADEDAAADTDDSSGWEDVVHSTPGASRVQTEAPMEMDADSTDDDNSDEGTGDNSMEVDNDRYSPSRPVGVTPAVHAVPHDEADEQRISEPIEPVVPIVQPVVPIEPPIAEPQPQPEVELADATTPPIGVIQVANAESQPEVTEQRATTPVHTSPRGIKRPAMALEEEEDGQDEGENGETVDSGVTAEPSAKRARLDSTEMELPAEGEIQQDAEGATQEEDVQGVRDDDVVRDMSIDREE